VDGKMEKALVVLVVAARLHTIDKRADDGDFMVCLFLKLWNTVLLITQLVVPVLYMY